nr:hypothetical protein [Tanacetum cinerariifolium]
MSFGEELAFVTHSSPYLSWNEQQIKYDPTKRSPRLEKRLQSLNSEIQLEHEKEDKLFVVVVKVVHEYYKMVVKEIEDELLEEMEESSFEDGDGFDIDGEDEDDIKNKLVMVSEEGCIS